MGKLSRDKGVAWERTVARTLGGVRVLTEPRDGNAGDVVTPEFLVQCKTGARPPVRRAIAEAVAAAVGRTPLAAIHFDRDGSLPAIDIVCIRLRDFVKMLGAKEAGAPPGVCEL